MFNNLKHLKICESSKKKKITIQRKMAKHYDLNYRIGNTWNICVKRIPIFRKGCLHH